MTSLMLCADLKKAIFNTMASTTSQLNYVSFYGFLNEEDLNNGSEKYIDSIEMDEHCEMDCVSLLNREKINYIHITMEDENGKRYLPE
jgi:hypothetical protein